jgi:hypothetical protein
MALVGRFAVCPAMVLAMAVSGCAREALPAPGGELKLAPSSLSFTATGANNAQTVDVHQTNYAGKFAASTTDCSAVATIASAGRTSFSVTPVGAGSCTFTIKGGGGRSATLSIGVTTTAIGGS